MCTAFSWIWFSFNLTHPPAVCSCKTFGIYYLAISWQNIVKGRGGHNYAKSTMFKISLHVTSCQLMGICQDLATWPPDSYISKMPEFQLIASHTKKCKINKSDFFLLGFKWWWVLFMFPFELAAQGSHSVGQSLGWSFLLEYRWAAVNGLSLKLCQLSYLCCAHWKTMLRILKGTKWCLSSVLSVVQALKN